MDAAEWAIFHFLLVILVGGFCTIYGLAYLGVWLWERRQERRRPKYLVWG